MVSYSVPSGGLAGKPRVPEQLSSNSSAKAESSPASTNQGFSGGTPQWQTHGSVAQSSVSQGQQQAGLARMSSAHHRHLPVSGGPSSPKVERQRYKESDEWEGSYEEYVQDRKRSKIRDSVHTISSQMQSQLLSPRRAAGSSGPALTRISSVPAPKYSESHHFGDSDVSQMTPAARLPRSVSLNPLDEPSPLGLTLKKTPSLLDLISMKLTQGGTPDHGSGNPDALAQQDTAAKNRATKCLAPMVTAQDKLKASNFPASILKIGTWERISRYEGDLVGKCYYAKRKLVWEVLESGLKSKIEIQWSDISAMKASCPENLPGTLEIEVSRPPLFFRETNPQPRKHTLWQATSDFTGGQATICKHHALQFPEGVLNRHYEKLVQCDPRLKSLVEGTLSMRTMPDFEHSSWFDGKHQHMPAHHPVGLLKSSYEGNKNQPTYVRPHMHPLPGNVSVARAGMVSDPKPEVRSIKMQSNDLASPSSVMDQRGSDESTSDTEDLRLHDDQSEIDGMDLAYPNPTNIGGHDLPDVKPSCHNLFLIGEHPFRQDRKVLDEIEQVLLGDSSSSPSEQSFMLAAKIGQMSAAMAEDFHLPRPIVSHALEGPGSSDASHLHPYSFQVKTELGLDHHPLNMIPSPGTSGINASLSQRDPSFNSLMSCFSKHGSAGDLLMNLPRVASLPQLFESPSQAPTGGRYDPAYTRPSYLGSEKLR